MRLLPLLAVLALTGCWGSDDLGSERGRASAGGTQVLPDPVTPPDETPPADPGDDTPGDDIPDDPVDPPIDPPVDPPVDPVPPPDPVDLTDGHLYLPTAEGIRWYYNGGALQAWFDGSTQIAGQPLFNLNYSNGLVDYVLSDDTAIGYGGSRYSLVNAADGITYSMDIKLARAHSIFVTSAQNYSGQASVSIQPLNIVYAGIFPYNGRVSPLGIKNVDAGELGSLPARGMRVMLNPGGWLGDLLVLRYPQLAELLARRTTDLWFAPGVGIVQRIDGGVTHTLTSVDGIQQPVVFDFAEGSAVVPAPVQIRLNGEVVTDNSWMVQAQYRTTPTGWLTVAFDGTGSWRASLGNLDQPVGLHAATVRMTRGSEQYDVPVIVRVR